MDPEQGGWGLREVMRPVINQALRWVSQHPEYEIDGPCDLVDHAHKFLQPLQRRLSPVEIKRYWAAIGNAHERVVMEEVMAPAQKCVLCQHGVMQFVPPTTLARNRRIRNLKTCNVCGLNFRNDLGYYQCLQPNELVNQTAPFFCPGAQCAHHDVE